MGKAIVGFVLGLIAGGIGALWGGPALEPYLPAFLADPGVETVVIKKRLEPDRLLLTIEAADQEVLATFTQRLEEIDLLVDEGDRLTLRLPGDEPFVKDPVIVRVSSGGASSEPVPSGPVGEALPREMPPRQPTPLPADPQRVERLSTDPPSTDDPPPADEPPPEEPLLEEPPVGDDQDGEGGNRV